MIKLNNKTALFTLAFSWIIVEGCSDKSLYEVPTPVDSSEYFNFSTKADFTFDIDYHQQNYGIVFEVFEEDPITVRDDGIIVKTSAEPIYRASTDLKGRYSGVVELPSALSEVYLYSDYMGTVGPVKLKVTNNTITYDQDAYRKQLLSENASTRGGNNWNVPAGFATLGSWDADGLPGYLLQDASIDPQFLLDISKAYPNSWETADKKTIWDLHPEYFYKDGQAINADVHFIKDTKAEMVYLKADNSKSNTVGYYFYETTNPPQSKEDIDKFYVAFPHVASYTVSGKFRCPLMLGNQIQIQYEDANGVIQDVIPAGWSMGLFLIDCGYDNGDIKNNGVFFCNSAFNEDKIPHAVALLDSNGQSIAVGFEDASATASCDYDFNDAIFTVRVEKDAIGPIPELPPGGEANGNYTVYKGTLAFEDMWPRKYDYDLNDVVLRYQSTVYKEYLTNRVYKVEDIFTPVHGGGTRIVGFGYQYPIAASLVKDVEIENPNASSVFMSGQNLEPGQDQPTIILFDNVRSVEMGKPIKVTTTFTGNNTTVTPPYNPFVVINSNSGRGIELHLSGKLPTKLFDYSYFGTEDDKSDPSSSLYYVADDNYVFAVDIASWDFKWCPETVSIIEAYPRYEAWAKSKGQDEKSWYKYPDTSISWD